MNAHVPHNAYRAGRNLYGCARDDCHDTHKLSGFAIGGGMPPPGGDAMPTMGRRGPPPTPAPILKLRGTIRSDRVHNAPDGPAGKPICPTWLDDEAKLVWKQIIPMLAAKKVLTRIDRNSLSRYG